MCPSIRCSHAHLTPYGFTDTCALLMALNSINIMFIAHCLQLTRGLKGTYVFNLDTPGHMFSLGTPKVLNTRFSCSMSVLPWNHTLQ